MIKQTVLKFQGALGLLGFGHKDDQEDGDSGNSTPISFQMMKTMVTAVTT